jgi:Flp pilus assembly pilin Flp
MMRPDDGASAVEYSLLVVGIAAILVTLAFSVGHWTRGTYTPACKTWSAQNDAPPPSGDGTC